MKTLVTVVLAMALVGCGATAKKIVAPSGKTGYSLNCGNNIDNCYEKAGELCPNGYTMLNQTTGAVGVPFQGGMVMAPQHTMAVECR